MSNNFIHGWSKTDRVSDWVSNWYFEAALWLGDNLSMLPHWLRAPSSKNQFENPPKFKASIAKTTSPNWVWIWDCFLSLPVLSDPPLSSIRFYFMVFVLVSLVKNFFYADVSVWTNPLRTFWFLIFKLIQTWIKNVFSQLINT